MEDVVVYSLSGDAVITHISQKNLYGITTPAGDKVVNINSFQGSSPKLLDVFRLEMKDVLCMARKM